MGALKMESFSMTANKLARLALGVLPVAAILSVASPAVAQVCPTEPKVEFGNQAGPFVPSLGFIPGEEWGSVYTAADIPASHFPIEITSAGFLWLGFGPPPCPTGIQSLEDAILIRTGDIANPGPIQYTLGGPVMTDGCINEFDLTVVPPGPGGDRIINAPPFMVTARLQSNPIMTFTAPARDQSGCTPGRNVIVCPSGCGAGGSSFADLCSFGCTLCPAGDWVVTLTYRRVNCGIVQFTDHCNGDGGDQMGCTDCPCSNNTMPGTIGGCMNSAGTGTRLSASGDLSVSVPGGSTTDLRFTLEGAPAGAFSVLLSGAGVAPQNMMNPCFGLNSGAQASDRDGLRCAVSAGMGAVTRHGGRSADASGEVMDAFGPSRVWGGEAQPLAGIAAQAGFVAGQSRFFQVTHREDPTMVCMRGLSTSQAVEMMFTP